LNGFGHFLGRVRFFTGVLIAAAVILVVVGYLLWSPRHDDRMEGSRAVAGADHPVGRRDVPQALLGVGASARSSSTTRTC